MPLYLDVIEKELSKYILLDYAEEGVENTLSDYYEQVDIPHKIFVYKAGLGIVQKAHLLDLENELFLKRLLLHDLSKFSKTEIAYAYFNFEDKSVNSLFQKDNFNQAWHHHKMNNPHHPEYWFDVKKDGKTIPMRMPDLYLLEMLADWAGASLTYGSSLEEWLPENLPRFVFHKDTTNQLMYYLIKIYDIQTEFIDEKMNRLKVRYAHIENEQPNIVYPDLVPSEEDLINLYEPFKK